MSTATTLNSGVPVSLIPESAPFTAEQRAWLNGFLAGWLGVQQPTQSADHAPTLASVDSPISATSHATSSDNSTDALPWHDPALTLDARLALAEGRPLELQLMAAMAQLNCGACGYACRTYSAAIARREESNLALCSPGGKETAKALKKILSQQVNATTSVLASSTAKETSPRDGEALRGYHRSRPVSVRFVSSTNLNITGSSKYTSHVVLDLTDSGVEYRVGDSLGVFPSNCENLVDDILRHLKTTTEVPAGTTDSYKDVRGALIREFDLARVTDALLRLLRGIVADHHESQFLDDMLDGQFDTDDFDVLDVLTRCPSAKPTVSEFIQTLGHIQPRLYSISSSPLAHPGEVHLTVGRVSYMAYGRMRKGVASTMFAERLKAGDTLSAFVHRSHEFTLPEDPNAAMIMIGPGTGIAPFRAFLEERKVVGASGQNWLFFGDQHEATDFLYHDELLEYCANGLLHNLDTAFSRDQAEKIYVQDRIRQRGKDLFAWIDNGAYLFVCGDAKHMARDVDRAIREIIATHGSLAAEQADSYVARLINEKRYVRDVY